MRRPAERGYAGFLWKGLGLLGDELLIENRE